MNRTLTLALELGLFASIVASSTKADPAAKVDFTRDVRPILSNYCFKCHGFDAKERQAGLRLDGRAYAFQPADSGNPTIVPGKPHESEMIRRVFSADDSERMPPVSTNKRLTSAEKDTLRRWIAQGAEYKDHWAFVSPRRPMEPAVINRQWPRNAIDHFILARLEKEGLHSSPEADRVTLLRRVTLDLTGLPPTPAEVDSFLADNCSDAYERGVDRLLASPHFGERLAVDWLDAARFADTNGYHIDNGRDMTRWREWVIDAFNTNMPYDRFTVEQLAGDLLLNSTLDQRVASGFHRNHMINFEGGAIPEEYLTAYIIDRVNTTGTVWLGLSVGCGQCHDHKYDPLTQKEFYRLYAFFNQVPEKGLDGNKGNAVPFARTPTRSQQQQSDRLTQAIGTLQRQIEAPMPAVDRAQRAWEKSAAAEAPVVWSPLDPLETTSAGGAALTQQTDKTILARGMNPATETYIVTAKATGGAALRLEVFPDREYPERGPGRSHNGNFVLTDVRLNAEGNPIALKSAFSEHSQTGFPVTHAIDADPKTGWAILPQVGKPHVAIFTLKTPVAVGAMLRITLAFQSQFAQHQFGRFRLSMTADPQPLRIDPLPPMVRRALALGPDKRSVEQQTSIRDYYRRHHSIDFKPMAERLTDLQKERDDLNKRITTTMVMMEMSAPRQTHLLVRGQYDRRGEQVTAGVPAFLPPLPRGVPANRLGLAKWLVDPDHPLTARVTVNRYWQLIFGTGLVRTTEDFGSQGELPSHPELLDWLATEFVRSGWDVKRLIRLLVTSATYRQTSRVTPGQLATDPENRLLARSARLRLQAEFIRDQALAASGLLNAEIGGHSVSPYQPPGLWEELMSREDGANWTAQKYTPSHGKDLYRRTMYTFWKRTCPPPTLVTFDAPDRETCTVRRARTNTPLQALVLLNDPTYVEAARKLAERVTMEAATTDERIVLAFRLVTARRPTESEIGILRTIWRQRLAAYRTHPQHAAKLLEVGESPRNEKLAASELAAWTVVVSAILNLDEAVTKG